VSRPRAAIVVTGSELVRGERTDRNGPFYAREALSLARGEGMERPEHEETSSQTRYPAPRFLFR